eukprot:TRINITY_DN2976_c0_g1_i1.p1 TRINITY_DN2976_c0_g1~~TRINITY_DN2976_c0_g1_i1.p1  ORF type:complete len:281 (+),score=84.02 TRINITY_DN2976_c0_g1_i1:28-843(+)
MLPRPHPPSKYFFLYDDFLGYKAPIPLVFCLGTAVAYLLGTYAVWPAMRPLVQQHRSIFTALRKLHNVALCLYSLFCCTTCAGFMYSRGQLDILSKGFEPMLCSEDMPDWLWSLNLTFVVSKLYEGLDTAFIVWFKTDSSKKDLSFLHVYHHATTFWLFLLVSNFASTAKMGLLLNGLVHFFMYAHYAFAFPKPLVPLITLSQIMQLAFVTWVWTVTPLRCPVHSGFIRDHFWEFITSYLMVPVYLVFFVHFFVKRFLFGGGKRSHGTKSA